MDSITLALLCISFKATSQVVSSKKSKLKGAITCIKACQTCPKQVFYQKSSHFPL